MRRKDQQVWVAVQRNKQRFEPVAGVVTETQVDDIPVRYTHVSDSGRAVDGTPIVRSLEKHEVLPEAETYTTEAACRAACVALMQARRQAMVDRHAQLLAAIDASIAEMEG